MNFQQTTGSVASVEHHSWTTGRGLSPAARKDVERLLGGRTRDIRLTDELAEMFRQRSWRQTAKIIRAWMVWVIVLDVLVFAINALLLPADIIGAMLASASLVLPAALLSTIVFRKPHSARVEGTVLLTSMFLILLSVALVGVNTGGEFYERHLTIMLFVAVTAIVIFPIPLNWASTLAGFALGIYLVFQLRNPNIGTGSAVAGALFFASGLAATVVARRTATILAQKTFLLELRDRLRLADLTDANERLEMLARTDPLTGVANRRAMMEALHRFWGNDPAPRTGAAMLMCDVDDFKHLNDHLGHAEGDRCLVKIAGIIQSCVRNDLDQVARFGGEEFLVFLPNCDEPHAQHVAERIRKAVEAASLPNPSSRVAPHVTLSIGVATKRPDSTPVPAEELLRRADAALYLAKKSGRNRVMTYV